MDFKLGSEVCGKIVGRLECSTFEKVGTAGLVKLPHVRSQLSLKPKAPCTCLEAEVQIWQGQGKGALRPAPWGFVSVNPKIVDVLDKAVL